MTSGLNSLPGPLPPMLPARVIVLLLLPPTMQPLRLHQLSPHWVESGHPRPSLIALPENRSLCYEDNERLPASNSGPAKQPVEKREGRDL